MNEFDRSAFKVFSVGNEDRTKSVLKLFINSHSANKEIKLASFEKEDDTSTILSSLFNTESDDMKAILTGPEAQIKEMIFRLVDRHDVTNDNIVVMGNKTRTSGMVTSLSKIQPEQEEIKLILLDKFGNEKVASSDFVSSEVKPTEVNENLSKEGEGAKFINNGLIEETRYQIRCSGVAGELEVLRTKLQIFFIRLKSFFSKGKFNLEAFEAVGPQLDEQLEGLNFAVDRVEICGKHFLIELAFLNRMYGYMVEAIELLKYYHGSNEPGRRLLFSVVELNVQLFELRNVKGNPDPTIDGYASKVRHYLQLLNSWAVELRLLGEVPFGLKMMFRKHFSLAEAALVPLASAIVKHEIEFS